MDYRHGYSTGRFVKDSGDYVNIADHLENTTDAFGINISESTRNVGDLAAHFPFSPERHRAFLNGNRLQIQYGNTYPEFEDANDAFIFKPSGGDNMYYRTAERFHYVVGYVIVPSWEFDINQQLQGDDKVVFGYGEPDIENDMADANGWFWEFRGGFPTTTVFLTTYRRGEKRDEKVVTDLPIPYTIPFRCEDRINWYNVGNDERRMTYTEDGEQINKLIAKTSIDTQKGPDRANFPVTMGVIADATTTGLEVSVGSIAVKVLGDVQPIFRLKEAVTTNSHSGGGAWEPLFALRKKNTDKDKNVKVNLSDLEILEVSADADVEILAIAVDPSLTDATDGSFSVPIYHSESNSTVQISTAITTFPDSTGTEVTSATDPGGYQVGFAGYFTAGTGTANRRSNASRGIRKRSIQDNDYVVVLAKTGTAMNITIGYETEQQY